MQPADVSRLIAMLAGRPVQLVVVATGGGTRALAQLVTTPGASAVVLEGLVPYSRQSVDRLLGGPQETYCSDRAARRLAIVAWQRAVESTGRPAEAVGVAVVASLKTLHPKRGVHRVIVAVQSLAATSVVSLALSTDARSRDAEEDVAALLVLHEIERLLDPAVDRDLSAVLRPDERVHRLTCVAPQAWRDLLANARRAVGAGTTTTDPAPERLLFPGSFDPLHAGHREMARIAEEIAERPVEFELSIANVEKPLLDYCELETRCAQFAGRPLWVTRAATFLEKLAIFPRSTFVLGADTFARLADPRYYGGSAEAAAAAVRAIVEQARGLVVFGRERGGVFEDPAGLDVPEPLRRIAYFVSQREFRRDISSTDLRRERLLRDRDGT